MTDFDQKLVRADLGIYKHAGWHTWTEADEHRVRALLKYARETMPHLRHEFVPFDDMLDAWSSYASNPALRCNLLELERMVDDAMRACGMSVDSGAFSNYQEVRNAFVRFVVAPPHHPTDVWHVESVRDDAATRVAAVARSRGDRKRTVEEIVREYRLFLHIYETVSRAWVARATA